MLKRLFMPLPQLVFEIPKQEVMEVLKEETFEIPKQVQADQDGDVFFESEEYPAEEFQVMTTK